MPTPIITPRPKSSVELAFTVTPEEAKPYLEQAAVDLQTAKPLPGFRPGKASYDDVKREFGEMKIWETALERIVRAQYVHTIVTNKIEAVGSPSISVDQLTPGQDIKFTATATVMPSVLTLAAYDAPIVTKNVKAVTDENVDALLEELRKMRREEVVTDQHVAKDGLVVVQLEIKKDGVTIEGGHASDYRVYLAESHYIPGFTDQLVGLKKGDAKTFSLAFPETHYQKHLAGQSVDFSVVVKEAYELRLPALDEAFAKSTGLDSMDALREKLRDNLTKEAAQKAEDAAEIEMLDKLIDGSKFSEIPELLLTEEVRRMYHELEQSAEEQGMSMSDYLTQLKRTADQVKLDMTPQAMRRVQAALLIKAVANKENITVEEQELDQEIDRILQGIKDAENKSTVSSPEYRDYLAAQMRNRKTIAFLKQKTIT